MAARLNDIRVDQVGMDNSRSRHSRQVVSRAYSPCREQKYFKVTNIETNITLVYAPTKQFPRFSLKIVVFPSVVMMNF